MRQARNTFVIGMLLLHTIAVPGWADWLVAWGRDDFGQVSGTPAGNDFTAVAVGSMYTVALKSDDSLVAWGFDGQGRVSNTPTGNDFAAVSAGWAHSVALKSDGSLVAWGYDISGQVSNTPAGNDFAAVSAGCEHTVALKSDGSLVAWGSDYWGQSNTPAGNDFAAVAAGYLHTVALKTDGSLIAWGLDRKGQVSNTPAGNDFVAVSAGGEHNVALKTDGSLVSWGDDYFGQVSNTPAGNDFEAVAAGFLHSVALKSDGSLVAWGSDAYGQVSDTPAGNDFTAVAAGGHHNVALISENTPPTANAGVDQIVEADTAEGSQVTLNGSGSIDPDSTPGTNDDIVSFDWFEGDIFLGIGEILDYVFPIGTHLISLVVLDSCGEMDVDWITVIVQDTTPPEVEVTVPQADTVVQDLVILTAEASDITGVVGVHFCVREPDGGNGTPIGYEDLSATMNETTEQWEFSFDTMSLFDDDYIVLAKARDTYSNQSWSLPVPFTVHNWAGAVTIDLDPDTFDLNSKSQTISSKIYPPDGYEVTDIDLSTILLEYEVASVQTKVDLRRQLVKAKFDCTGMFTSPGEVELEVVGRLNNGLWFLGTDTINVIKKGGNKS